MDHPQLAQLGAHSRHQRTNGVQRVSPLNDPYVCLDGQNSLGDDIDDTFVLCTR